MKNNIEFKNKCINCKKKLETNDSLYICNYCNSFYCNCILNNFDSLKFFCLKYKNLIDLTQENKLNTLLSHLIDVRVIQRDLVYVVGLPIQYASEDILLKYEFFGQYGPIKKLVVNTSNIHSLNQIPSVSAYITFKNFEDAIECIYSLESFILEGSSMKASFGTTKYCSSFLKGQKCNNPDCLYLHQCGDKNDSFSKDEITGNSNRFIEMTRPLKPLDYNSFLKQDLRSTILPPKRILKKDLNIFQNSNLELNLIEKLNLNNLNNNYNIIYNDFPNKSLNIQLNLNFPSFRNLIDYEYLK